MRRKLAAGVSSLHLPAICLSIASCGLAAARADVPLSSPTLSLEPAPPPDAPSAPFCDPEAPESWTVQFEPVVWFVAASGKTSLPVTSGTGPGAFTTEGDRVSMRNLGLDGANLRASGEIHISADLWRFSFAGADASVDQSGLAASETFRLGAVSFAPGDTLDAEFQLGTYEVTAGYQFWSWDPQQDSQRPEDAVPCRLRLFALAGGRIYDVEFEVRRTSGAPAAALISEFFVEPILGVRFEADFTRAFGIDVQLSGGVQPFGSHFSYSIDIAAGFHYRPTPTFGLQLGYRQLAFLLEDGEDLGKFEYEGRLAGLFVGATLRF